MCGHTAALKRLTESHRSSEPLLSYSILTNLQPGVLMLDDYTHNMWGWEPVSYYLVPHDGSTSVDIEITAGLFHASCVAIRKL